MKKTILILLLSLGLSKSYAQFGVAYHHSSLPFVGLNYQIKDVLIPELRIGTNDLFENTSIELDLNAAILGNDSYQFYAGVGAYFLNQSTWITVPIGFNFYPLENKSFGFHMELAPLINEPSYLRGSFGIRYRFMK